MAAAGDPQAYFRFKAARAMGDAARSSGAEIAGAAGAGMGLGVGAGFGMMLPGMIAQATRSRDRGTGRGCRGGFALLRLLRGALGSRRRLLRRVRRAPAGRNLRLARCRNSRGACFCPGCGAKQ